MCVCHYTHTHIYIYTHMQYIYIYTHMQYIYIYTYIHRKRDRERERKKETTLHAYTFQDIAWIQPFQLDHPRKCWENVMQIDWRLAGPCTPSCKRSTPRHSRATSREKKNKDPKKCKNSILYIYIYMCVTTHTHIYIYIHICSIYIHTYIEREIEREREKERNYVARIYVSRYSLDPAISIGSSQKMLGECYAN